MTGGNLHLAGCNAKCADRVMSHIPLQARRYDEGLQAIGCYQAEPGRGLVRSKMMLTSPVIDQQTPALGLSYRLDLLGTLSRLFGLCLSQRSPPLSKLRQAGYTKPGPVQ
jgi:hypothetical protein